MENISIATIREVDRDKTLDTLLLGFSTDPLGRWFSADASTYLQSRVAFNAFAGRAIDFSSAFASSNFEGVSCWLPPGEEPDEETLMSELQRLCDATIIDEVMQVFEAMSTYHPQEPCWYLPMIAVDPNYQGMGIGAQLMKHALAMIDEQHAPAYLESSNQKNVSLYERHGFEQMGQIQIGGSPLVTPMIRQARA